jgi:outer membrane lipoprotein-sorting protein
MFENIENEDQFQELVDGLQIDDEPNAEHRRRLRKEMIAMYDTTQPAPSGAPSRGRSVDSARRLVFRRSLLKAAVAAAALIALGVGWLALRDGNGRPVGLATCAFADVQRKIRNTETLVCMIDVEMPNPQDKTKTMTMKMKMMLKEPGLMRQEFVQSSLPESKGMVNIFDMRKGQTLTLIPSQKQAVVMNLGKLDIEKAKAGNYFEKLKKAIEGAEKELGVKDVAGRKLKGFRVTRQEETAGISMDIWVDAKTADPVRIEMTMPSLNMKIHMTDFRQNVEVDDSLFSMTVPEGYKGKTMDMDLSSVTEKDLLDGLRAFVPLTDNVFPPTLMDVGKLVEHFREMEKKGEEAKQPSEGEVVALAKTFSRMVFFAAKMQQEGELRYFGGGVKFGEKAKPILYYRPTKDATTYRVVYGDLSIKEVEKDDLPKIPEKPGENSGEDAENPAPEEK